MLRKSNFLGYVVLIILVFGAFGLLFGSSNFFNKDDEFNDKKLINHQIRKKPTRIIKTSTFLS